MAFQGGVLSTIGITPSVVRSTVGGVAQTAATIGLNQVWQGAGQSFAAQAGQQLTGQLANSAINIALDAATGAEAGNIGGRFLTEGRNIVATGATQFLTGPVANSINNQISKSLKGAGPFGPVLSSAAGAVTNAVVGAASQRIGNLIRGGPGQAAGGLLGGLGGAPGAAAGNGNATNFKMFPGGGTGGEAPADYSGGNSYTRGDVVFSIQPANQGPQAFGDFSAAFDSKASSKLKFGDLINASFGIPTPAVNVFKKELMIGDFSSTATAGFG